MEEKDRTRTTEKQKKPSKISPHAEDDQEKVFLKKKKKEKASISENNSKKYKIKNVKDFKKLQDFINNCNFDKTQIKVGEGNYTTEKMIFSEHFIIISKENGSIVFFDKETHKKETEIILKDLINGTNIRTTCFDVKDTYLICGSNTGLLSVVDLDDSPQLKIVTQLQAHQSSISGVKVSKYWIYTVSHDTKMKIWNFDSLVHEQKINSKADFKVSDYKVKALEICSKFVFTNCEGKKIKVWKQQDFTENSKIKPFTQISDHKKTITVIKIQDNYFYSASLDRSIKIYNIDKINEENNRLVANLKFHSKPVMDIAFDKNYLYSGSLDKTIKIWDIEAITKKQNPCSQKLISSIKNKKNIYHILVDENYIYHDGEKGLINAWKKPSDTHIQSEKPLKTINTTINESAHVEFLTKEYLLNVGKGNALSLWKVNNVKLNSEMMEIENLCDLKLDYSLINKVIYKNSIVAIIDKNKIYFCIIDGLKNKSTPKLRDAGFYKIEKGEIGSIDFFGDDKLIIGKSEGGFTIFDYFIKNEKVEVKISGKKLYAHNTCIKSIKTHKNLIFTGSENSKISIWEYLNPENIEFKKSLINTGEIGNMVLHSDENYLFVCCVKEAESCINVWDLRKEVEEDIDPLKIFTYEELKFTDIIIEEEKKLLYFSTVEGIIGAFNLVKPVYRDKEPIFTFKGNDEEFNISKINLSFDKNILVSGSKNIQFWNFDEKQIDIGELIKKDVFLLNNTKKLFESIPRSKYIEISRGIIHHLKKFYPEHQITCRPFFELFCSLAIEEIIHYYLDVIGLGSKYDEVGNIIQIIKQGTEGDKGSHSLSKIFNKVSLFKKKISSHSAKEKKENYEDSTKRNLVKSIFITLKYLTEKKVKIASLMKDSTIYDIIELSTFQNTICINFIHSYLGFYLKKVEGDHKKVNICALDNDIQILRPQNEQLLIENPKKIKKLIFYYTGFKINLQDGSQDSKNLFDVINNMSNSQIIDLAPLIKHKFRTLQKYFIIQLIYQLISAITINLFVYSKSRIIPLFIIGLGFLICSFYYEVKCFFHTKNYFKSASNVMDVFIDIGGFLMLVLNYTHFYKENVGLAWFNLIVITALNLRTFTLLRAFKGFRYLINMILKVYFEVKYFLMIIIVFLFINVAMLYGKEQINLYRKYLFDSENFSNKVSESTKLCFGDYSFPEDDAQTGKKSNFLDWIIFLPNSITIGNILLNLIIAMVWDVYAVFNREKIIIDLQIQIDLIREMEGFLSSWGSKNQVKAKRQDFRYLQYVVKKTDENERKEFDNEMKGFSRNLKIQIDNLEKKLDDKIEILEESVFDIDKSMKTRGELFDKQVAKLEDKMDKIMELLNGKNNDHEHSNKENDKIVRPGFESKQSFIEYEELKVKPNPIQFHKEEEMEEIEEDDYEESEIKNKISSGLIEL